MSTAPFDAITGPSYAMFSNKAENEKSVCVYRERVETNEGISPFVLNKSPGLKAKLFGLGPGRWRGFYELNGYVFGVLGNKLYIFTLGSLSAPFGPMADDGLPVQMAASPNTLMIVSAGKLYRVNSNTLTQVSLSFQPIGIASLKNYFIVLSATMQQFYWSVDDGATFDPLNVQTAEADANNLLSIQSINQLLCIIGNRLTQWFSVGANPNKPFVPIDSGVMRSGTVAGASVEKLGSSLLWLERQKEGQYTVVMTSGFTAHTISNNYVANKIRSLAAASTVDDAIGMSYRMNNQEFYRLTFPTADYTLEYNKTLGEWEDPLSWDWQNGRYRRHRANCMVSALGVTLVGDYANGEIYEMSPDLFHDAGYPMRWNRRTPHVVEGDKRIQIDRLGLGVQTGVGLMTPLWLNNYSLTPTTFIANLATQQGAGNVTGAQATALLAIYNVQPYDITLTLPDPTVLTPLGFYEWGRRPMINLKYSGDGGKGGQNSWSSELPRDLGRAGENPQVFWSRLGANRDFVLDLYGDDPCQLAITSAWLDAQALGN